MVRIRLVLVSHLLKQKQNQRKSIEFMTGYSLTSIFITPSVKNILISGFGVGLTWSSALIKINKLKINKIIKI